MSLLAENKIRIPLGISKIYSDRTGVNQILDFYFKCQEHNDCTIEICLTDLEWFDGNLCSLLGALIYRLNKTNNLYFSVKQSEVEKKFDILIHNQFLPIEITGDSRKSSCIPFKGFEVKDKDGFMDYVENDVLKHSAMPKFEEEVIDKLLDDLGELYGNIDKHAFTEMPFYLCGQYYPKSAVVKFTICDLGIGFLEKIRERIPEIQTYEKAIQWAAEGNSSKPDAPGGTGLIGLRRYFADGKGKLQIISGDSMWCSETAESKPLLFPDGSMPLKHFFQGTVINLEFNRKALNL